MTETLRAAPWGETVAGILSAAIAAVDPYKAVLRHLKRDGEILSVAGESYPLSQYEHVYVVGAGKAGFPMAQAVVAVLGDRVSSGQVTVKEGHAGNQKAIAGVRIVEAGHSLPDERGLKSTQEILALLDSTTENDLVICLISGGGSALLTAPVAGVSLDDLRALTELLITSGGTINEMNTLRKVLDRVKGGGLATVAAPAQILTLILSDVVGDPLDMIASGPTVANPQTFEDSLAVIEKYQLTPKIPSSILTALQNPSARSMSEFIRVNNHIIGDNETAIRAALAQAKQVGFNTQLLTTTLQGEAWEVGVELAGILRKMATSGEPVKSPGVVVAGGETTVTVRGDGRGGRNQEMALAAVVPLAGLADVALITLATDGGDGPTDAAGGVVTGETMGRARSLGLDPAAYLQNNDSYTFFSRLGDNLKTGPTQTNVNDLVFLIST